MLDGLDEFASEDPERRKQARHRLYDDHEAAANAVPFVLELAADPATPDRDLILLLLDGLTVGEDDWVLPEGVPAAYQELPAYRAIREGVPLFRKLLWDGDPEIEAQAAKLLAWFPDEADGSVEALWARLDSAPPDVAGACLAAIGLLGGRHQLDRLTPLLRAADPYRRWGAAIALARIAGREAPDPTLDVLLDAATSNTLPDMADPGVAFDNGDMPGYAIRSLRLLGPRGLDAMLGALPGCERLVHGVVPYAFPEPIEPDTPFAELTDDQQRVLREVARSGWVVDWQLRRLDLPETPEALDAYIRGVKPRRRFWGRP
ncbi:MAG TPA: HEAT repeat domain-containing protein [Solirubrobacter sp.]|nr:HEAT repeat domain-containing protein [Solirubrobacter sp.]